MVVFAAGCVLALLGVASAVMLMAGELGLGVQPQGMSLWIFFPLFALVGWSLVVVAGRDLGLRRPMRRAAAAAMPGRSGRRDR